MKFIIYALDFKLLRFRYAFGSF